MIISGLKRSYMEQQPEPKHTAGLLEFGVPLEQLEVESVIPDPRPNRDGKPKGIITIMATALAGTAEIA
ncbi:hypothetical protein CYMTET_17766 [Cymbomonas tetramitiformis]|uniref:Uncharacterized protein n=1 Tax=Cymbomonas tetramitiformis TaxID=36881 RepID=A0AAE0G9M7_9CHLO|nr:hypothetical protein CYMTET_17766 [Cymbomonas tetramitiformis]